jgi:tetratricopeptide (TPR) repeat protein
MSFRHLLVLFVWTLGTAACAQEADVAQRLQRAESAAAADPMNAQLRFRHGVLLLDLERDAEAMQVFQRMGEDFPELPEPYNNIALLHARAGRYEAARQALETALRNDPGYRPARLNLGDVLLRLALQSWETAAAAAPPDAALQRKLQLARELIAPAR